MEVLVRVCVFFGNNLFILCIGICDLNDKWKYYLDNGDINVWLDMCVSMEKVIDIVDKYNLYLGIELELVNVVFNFVKVE